MRKSQKRWQAAGSLAVLATLASASVIAQPPGRTTSLGAAQVAKELRLEPHPEGGKFAPDSRLIKRTRGGRVTSSAIYYAMDRAAGSRLHRVGTRSGRHEYWVHNEGNPVQMVIVPKRGKARVETMGRGTGHRFIHVPAGAWQGARVLPAKGNKAGDDHALISNIVVPNFSPRDFEIASAKQVNQLLQKNRSNRSVAGALRHLLRELAPVAVVTGANRGIGLALTRKLAGEGYRVIAAVRESSKSLDGLARTHLVEVHTGVDATNRATLRTFARRLERNGERVDLLLNNAGMLAKGPQQFNTMHSVNAEAPVRLTRALDKVLKDDSRVVFTSSIVSSPTHGAKLIATLDQKAQSLFKAYGESKARLNAAARALNRDYRVRGSKRKVLLIHPGWTKTRMGGPGGTFTPSQTAGKIFDYVVTTKAKTAPLVDVHTKKMLQRGD